MTLVVFDAGHYKYTPGKRSPKGEREWYFNEKVVRAAMARMREYGVSVKRTDDPTGNKDVSLGARAARANAWGATVFVSCHHNAMGGGWHNGGGVETYYYSGNSSNSKAAQLARAVNPRVAKAMGLKDRGVKKANFAVLRETRMPAILVEGGFMDSRVDIKALRSDAKLKAQGIAIADGVAQYLGLKVKGSATPVKASIYVLYGELLKFGDTGAKVGKMQDDLTKLGFKTKRDNSFGPATEKQVKAFQKAHKLKVDGLVGPGTQTKMLTLLNAKKEKPKPLGKKLGRVVLLEELNYRKAPSFDAGIYRTLPKGHECDYYEIQDYWMRLGRGWVSNKDGKYVKITEVFDDKPKEPAKGQTLYRVIVDGKRKGAYADNDNVIRQARKAVEMGADNITIEEVK